MGEKSDKKMNEKDQAQIEKRRRQNRESQRRYRERHRSRYTRDTPLLDVTHNTLPFEQAHYWPGVSGASSHPAALSTSSLSSDPFTVGHSSLPFPLSQFVTNPTPSSMTPNSTGTRNSLDAAYHLDPRLVAPTTTPPTAVSALLTSPNPNGLDWPNSASSASPINHDFLMCPTTTTMCSNSVASSSYDYEFTPYQGLQHPPSPPASSLSSPALSVTTTTTAAGPTPSPSPGYGHHSQQHLRLPHHHQQQHALSASPPYLGLGLGLGMSSLGGTSMGRSSSWAGSRDGTPEDSGSIPFSSASSSGGFGGAPVASGVLGGRVSRRKRSTTSVGSAPASGSPLSWTGKTHLSPTSTDSGAGMSGWGVDGMLSAYMPAGGGAILTNDDIVAGLTTQR